MRRGGDSVNPPIIVWGEPPPGAGGRNGKYTPVVEELKRRPNEWGQIARRPTEKAARAVASTLSAGKIYQRQAAPGKLRTVVRRTPSDDYGVWARWVPPT